MLKLKSRASSHFFVLCLQVIYLIIPFIFSSPELLQHLNLNSEWSKKSKGSDMGLTNFRNLRLVAWTSFLILGITKTSFSVFQWTPSARSVGSESTNKSRSGLVDADFGSAAITCFELLMNFVRFNPPHFIIFINSSARILASGEVADREGRRQNFRGTI